MPQRPFFLFLCSSALFLFFIACKKEPKIENFPFTDKKFYCNSQTSYSNSGAGGGGYGIVTNKDLVIRCYVEQDSLKLLNYSFPILESTQDSFALNLMGSGSSDIMVHFYNNYDSIYIRFYDSNNYNFTETITYEGKTSNLKESLLPHAYLSELAGNYLLAIQNKNDCNSTDSSYTTSLLVSKDSSKVFIGNEQFSIGLFHSYYTKNSYFSGSGTNSSSIYWQSDSLYFSYLSTGCSSQSDSILYSYQGRKQ